MVDELIKVIEAIKVHGILPAVVAIIIFVILTLVGVLAARKTAEPEVQKTAEKPTGLIGKGIARWFKGRKEEAERVLGPIDNLEPMVFKDLLLRKQLVEFMEDPAWGENGQPTRVIIFSYHNGGHYTGGDLMSKMSLRVQVQNKNTFLSEVTGDDVVRGLFRIDFPMLYEKLLQQGRFYISNVQTIRHSDQRLYSLLSRSNINAAYIQQLNDTNGGPIGFLLVGYTDVPKDQNYVTQKTSIFATYLSGTLNMSLCELRKMFEDAKINTKDN